MLHGRVVRPPSYGARLAALDEARSRSACPGVTAVVRDGNFLGVVAEREEQAIRALRPHPRASRSGKSGRTLPATRTRASCSGGETEDEVISEKRDDAAAARRVAPLEAEYTRPLHRARLDRPVLRGRELRRRPLPGVDAQPGHLPAAQGPRDGARRGREARHRDRAHGRRRLLRPQRRGRRRARRGAARARGARAAGARAVDARGRIRLGAVRLADGRAHAGRPRRARQHRRAGPTSCGATATPRAPAAEAA